MRSSEKVSKGGHGNKYRLGMKNKPTPQKALIKSNIERAVVYEITKGSEVLYLTRRSFVKIWIQQIVCIYKVENEAL